MADADAATEEVNAREGSLAQRYKEAVEAAGRKPNHLVLRCLLESQESGSEAFSIEAPGSHPLTFSSRIGDEDMGIFAQVFRGSVRHLERLDLSSNLLSSEGAAMLATGLLGPSAEALHLLSLRGNAVTAPGCKALCQCLRHCPKLRSLDLSWNPLEKAGGLAVVELLTASKTLEELFLADAELDMDVLVAMATALLTTEAKLQVLDLENPRISTVQEEHTVHLARALRRNTSLRELRLGKQKMRDEGLRQLVSFLVENKTLQVLDLRCNDLGVDGAKHLGVLLSDDCRLSVLNLSGNRIGEKSNVSGAEALAEALTKNKTLRALSLNNNQLCDKALQVLAGALEHNTTLEKLALFHNQWDQPASGKFHKILNDSARAVPLKADFMTNAMEEKIDICLLDSFSLQ